MQNAISSLTRWSVAGVSAALLLAACGGSGDGGGAGGAAGLDLKIGAIDSVTGGFAQVGRSEICGIQVASDAVNKDDAVSGVGVDVEVGDTQSEIATGARLATSMTGNGTNLFVGNTASSFLLAQMPIYNDAKALYTSGLTNAPEVITKGDLPLRIHPDGDQAGKFVADLLTKLRVTSVVFVGDQGAYGEGAIAGTRKFLSPDIDVKESLTVDATGSDFGSTVSRIRSAKADATVFFLAGAVREVAFMREYARGKLDARAIAGPGVLSDPIVQSAGGAADGVITGVPYAPYVSNPQNDVFLAAVKKYGPSHEVCKDTPVSFLMENGYCQILLLAQAAKAADSSDPEKIRAAAIDGSFELPRGTITFQKSGQLNAKYLTAVGDGSTGLVAFDPTAQ